MRVYATHYKSYQDAYHLFQLLDQARERLAERLSLEKEKRENLSDTIVIQDAPKKERKPYVRRVTTHKREVDNIFRPPLIGEIYRHGFGDLYRRLHMRNSESAVKEFFVKFFPACA